MKKFLAGEGHELDSMTQSYCAALGGSALHSAGIQDLPTLPKGSHDPSQNNNFATNYNKWGRGVDTGKENVNKGDLLIEDKGPGPTGDTGGRPWERGHFRMLSGKTCEGSHGTEYEYSAGNEFGGRSRSWVGLI